jgi:hypothetical protein
MPFWLITDANVVYIAIVRASSPLDARLRIRDFWGEGWNVCPVPYAMDGYFVCKVLLEQNRKRVYWFADNEDLKVLLPKR